MKTADLLTKRRQSARTGSASPGHRAGDAKGLTVACSGAGKVAGPNYTCVLILMGWGDSSMTETVEASYLGVDQLTVGIYVYLDLGWTEHPFTFSHFRIKSDDQIAIIRRLGLRRVRWDPAKSVATPLPAKATASDAAVPPPPAEDSPEIAAKKARVAAMRQRRQAIQGCERDYADAGKTINDISKNLIAKPQECQEAAAKLVGQIAESLLADKDISIHLMNDKIAGEEIYYHSLNVAVLSMMLGRELGLPAEALQLLGMGGIFHDIGKFKIPHKVLIKADNPTKAEADFLQQHCNYGVEIGQKVRLPPEVMKMIAQHHEAQDGSGYPLRLKAEQIHSLARILAAVNVYDNLCNPVNVLKALTPHEALSQMYSQHRAKYDSKALGTFIRCLGVYPPGTVVKLSNDEIGMVVHVNTASALKPSVLIYDDGVPKDEAIVLDLAEEPDLTVTKAIRPSQLPSQVYDYLSPRKRVSYYLDAHRTPAGGSPP